MPMHALVVVDVNHFFLESAAESFAEDIANHIRQSHYDLIVFSVFRNRPDSNFVKSLNWTKCDSEEDAALPGALKKFMNDQNVFQKATYSAFTETKIDDYLRENNIDEITLCGIDTDACVLATAFSAFDRGYKVHVNFDLTFSGNDLGGSARMIIEQSILQQDKQQQ
jgi:nicotinamidase-related amidase